MCFRVYHPLHSHSRVKYSGLRLAHAQDGPVGLRYLTTLLWFPSRLTFHSKRTATTSVDAARSYADIKTSDKDVKFDKDVEEYWRAVLDQVDKPSACRLLQYVNPSIPLGINSRSSPNKPPIYTYFYQTKLQHPTKVLLVRVGEFYETIGIDAILLVQFAGLNPMGKDGNPPRAGCPRMNLRRTVSDLVNNAGLSVVVCEEAPEPYTYGSIRKQPKQRYIAAVVTPAAPHFLHGLVDEDTDIPVDSAPPLLGIVPSVGGYSIIEVDAELYTVRVTQGLTEDAVYARLHEGGLSPPLFVHIPPPGLNSDPRVREAIPEGEWERRVASIFRTQFGSVQRYSDRDPVDGMINRVKQQLGIDPDIEFRLLSDQPTNGNGTVPNRRPRPLYHSTASNLGLHKTRGVPNLLDYCLPQGSPLTSRRWMRKLLLLPPPPSVAAAIHAACRSLLTIQTPIPIFHSYSPANIVLKLRVREANDTFFRELAELCRAVTAACADPELEMFIRSVLIATASETGIHLVDADLLAKECAKVLEIIHKVIDNDEGVGEATSRMEQDELVDQPLAGSLSRLFDQCEDCRGKIRVEKVEEEHQAVEQARDDLIREVSVALELASTAVEGVLNAEPQKLGTRNSASKPSLMYDVNNVASWIKIPKGSSFSKAAHSAGMINPKDRNGRIESSVFSTPELEIAHDSYRRACSVYRDAVRTQLRELALALGPHTSSLVTASMFGVIAVALDGHVREALRRGWAMPQLSQESGIIIQDDKHTENKGCLHIKDMWPYWLGGPGGMDVGVVKNSLDLGGMVMLTGPNMAGKSTILRSTCAVALLGACGLAVPAALGTEIPFIDAFMLRNFSSDSPLEGRSNFAVEMTEMRYVLSDVTRSSLVLIDELGRGTEVRGGAALAGAMLEALDASRCRGIFATHLHSLRELNLKLPNTQQMMMEVVRDVSGKFVRRPTWKLVPGWSSESLALEVAAQCQLPNDVISRAEELYSKLMHGAHHNDGKGFVEEQVSKIGTAAMPELGPLEIPSCSGELRRAAAILKSTATSIIVSTYNLSSSGNPREPQVDSQFELGLNLGFVPVAAQVPPQTVGRSCVYVARRRDGWLYVGFTDALQDRVRAHRQRYGGSRVADPYAEFVYLVLHKALDDGPMVSDIAQLAETVEAQTIRALQARGFGLLSDADARKRYIARLDDRH